MNRNNFKSTALNIFLVLAVVVITGCQEAQVTREGPKLSGTEEAKAISAYELGRRLGLRVTDTTVTHITLKNSNNTVLIFTYTNGEVFVNAKSIGEVGFVDKINGIVRLPESLVLKIRSALRTTVTTQVRPVTYTRKLSGKIVIDAGHGGKDPGAKSRLGFYEKTINLEVAKKISYLLRQKGLTVIMTRNSDTFVELEERARIANRQNADLFVSIHADSASRSSTRGYTTYVAKSASWSAHKAARGIGQTMAGTGLDNLGVRKADFRVLVHTRCPAVLVELGFLSNYQEAGLLRNNAFQNRLARAIADGISNYFK